MAEHSDHVRALLYHPQMPTMLTSDSAPYDQASDPGAPPDRALGPVPLKTPTTSDRLQHQVRSLNRWQG